jgi:hypothetical protein
MTENPLSKEIQQLKEKKSKLFSWLLIVVPILLLGICCLALAFVVDLVSNVNIKKGGYSIESITLSSELKDNQPVDIKDVFMPSETIICTVKTIGIEDGIIGMRWYHGEDKIYQHIGKTTNNTIATYIQSNKYAILPEGKYRVEIFIVDEAIDTVYFEVKIYHPTVSPPISTPDGHQKIDAPWFPEVPFAFDEVWNIDGTQWEINEVKIVLMDNIQEYFVAVVVNTDMTDMLSASEDEIKSANSRYCTICNRKWLFSKSKNFRN